jgi:sarcosine oxidase subunit alpha
MTGGKRLPARPGETVNRAHSIEFTFNGTKMECYEGDTVATALYSNGRRIFGRSFKYHRPRGLLCVSGRCPNCLMNIDGQPNVRACITAVKKGMRVEQQNAWPSLDHDIGSIIDRFSFLLTVGFYYKTFIHPKWIWPIARTFIRKATGYGKVDTHLQKNYEQYEHYHKYVDVAVVGGGPAGLSAAIEASRFGFRVLLVDDQPQLGGRLRYKNSLCENCGEFSSLRGHEAAAKLVENILSAPNVEVLKNATCIGMYEGNLLGISQGNKLYKVRARKIVIATGCFERSFAFTNNDVPGIFLGEGLQRLINLFSVKPGERVLVVTNNRYGYEVTFDLVDAGIEVAGLVIAKGSPALDSSLQKKLTGKGVPILDGYTLVEAHGSVKVRGATVAKTGEQGEVISAKNFTCDTISLSIGFEPASALLYHAGCKIEFDEELGEPVPSKLKDNISAAGDVTGIHDLQITLLQGKLAGLQTAGALAGEGVKRSTTPDIQDLKSQVEKYSLKLRTLTGQYRTDIHPGLLYTSPTERGKRIVCICEDITAKDMKAAIEEGFDDIEPLKRYTTFTMGPCQGKMCNMVCTAIHAQQIGLRLGDIERTTARPPYQPLTIGVLNGPPHRPVKVTALHHKHEALNATWMDMGEWKRPKNYGSVEQEYRAIRERVGIMDVGTLGRFLVNGPDAGEFLDFVYTHIYSTLKLGKARYALLLTETGKVLDDGIIARIAQNEYLVTSSTGNAEGVEEWLKWWQATGSNDVDITNMTAGLAGINVAGPKSRELLSKLVDVDLSTEAIPYMSCLRTKVAGIPAIILRIGFVGEVSFEIHFPAEYAEYLWDRLLSEGKQYDIRPVGVEAMRLLSLDKRHIWPSLDTDSASDALEADLAWAVKFEKPDFVGKHYLLMTQQNGLRHKIVGFVVKGSGVVDNGDVIVVGGKVVGRVTTAGFSYLRKRHVGIAWVPIEYAKEGSLISVTHDGQRVEAEVVSGPFYDPEGKKMKS